MQTTHLPRVCHVLASINEYTGGTAVYVNRLSEYLDSHVACHLLTLNYQHRGQQLLPAKTQIHSFPSTLVTRYTRGYHPQAHSALQKLALSHLDLIHNHGLWMVPNFYARQVALANRLPLVISPHGMLEAWSLNHSWARKRLAWLLYEQKNLLNATVIQAASAEEARTIRYLGFKQPIAIIPCGVDLSDCYSPIKSNVVLNAYPNLAGKKWLLFLSRLHPKKGIDNLLQIWQTLSPAFPDWELIIAGPSSIKGYQEKLEAIAETLNLSRVSFVGMVSGELKDGLLDNADLFVLPTHSENFGIAVAEALAHKVPVVTTKATPWQEIQQYQCGWWVEDQQVALLEALTEAMNLPAELRSEMGKRGYLLIKAKYSWNSVAEQMASVYRWILGGGKPPDCIQLDQFEV